MTYTANKKAYGLLESLAYWMAEVSYCREKDPDVYAECSSKTSYKRFSVV